MKQATKDALNALDSMWAQVDAIRREIGDEVISRPPDCFTVAEYVARLNLSETTAKRSVERMVKTGKLRKLRAYVPDSAGRNVATNVYQVIQ